MSKTKQKTIYATLDRSGDVVFHPKRPKKSVVNMKSTYPKGTLGWVCCRRVRKVLPALVEIPEDKVLKIVVTTTVVESKEG
jgi:hypothetical protein